MSTKTQHAVSPKSSKEKQRTKMRSAKTSRQQPTVRRATVSLSADSSEIVERFKSMTGMSTSRAIEEIIRRSEPRKPRIKMVDGLAVFDVELANGTITTEEIRELEDSLW